MLLDFNHRNVWFMSDPHFGHHNLATVNGSNWSSGQRPFDSVEEHNDTIINSINTTIKSDDVLVIAGDITLNNARDKRSLDKALSYLNRINCRYIYMVVGNHDKGIMYELTKRYRKLPYHPIIDRFVMIAEVFRIRIKGISERVIVSHLPFNSWDHCYKGSIHLHGHVHNINYVNHSKSFNLCMENIFHNTGEWKPLNIDQIEEILKDKPIDVTGSDIHRLGR